MLRRLRLASTVLETESRRRPSAFLLRLCSASRSKHSPKPSTAATMALTVSGRSLSTSFKGDAAVGLKPNHVISASLPLPVRAFRTPML